MKNYLIGFLLGFIVIGTEAATTRNSGFFITGDYGGEQILGAEQSNQIVDWIRFTSNGVPIFSLPSSGIIQPNYGGTGTNNVNSFVRYTYNTTFTTNALGDTNHIYALGFGTGSGVTNVNIVYTRYTATLYFGTNGTMIYSNAAIGAFAISNSFGDLLYTNSQVNNPTNAGWAVGRGKASAGAITNQDQ